MGGGPGGAGCALALKNLAREQGKSIRVILYEGKIFEGSIHYNQCAGVLSPPIIDILERELLIPFPWDIVQREVKGYVLHSDSEQILLREEGEPTYAVRRVNFDEYLLKEAGARGVEVVQSRVTDVEFFGRGVMVYSESNQCRADVVVGAFGMDDGTARIFERSTSYRQPPFLSTIVTKIHPGENFMGRFGNFIHAFLPPLDRIEFGAITPKMNHLTVNIAGASITWESMEEFLAYPPVRGLLPPGFRGGKIRGESVEGNSLFSEKGDGLLFFKGRFPLGVGRGFYGDRYVIVGDAAGLLRPFKGKGINMSILTALQAARTMMNSGVSREAFGRNYRSACREVISDIPYGKVLRFFAVRSSRLHLLDAIINLAKRNPILERALFNSVSAHKSFKKIFKETRDPGLFLKLLGLFAFHSVKRILSPKYVSSVYTTSERGQTVPSAVKGSIEPVKRV